jgi:hypothetical protein
VGVGRHGRDDGRRCRVVHAACVRPMIWNQLGGRSKHRACGGGS